MVDEFGARGGNRTRTAVAGLGILSPVRLPISPPGRFLARLLKIAGATLSRGCGFSPVVQQLYRFQWALGRKVGMVAGQWFCVS